MRFNVKALAITVAVMFGGAVFTVALLNRFFPAYGNGFLRTLASIYPGFHPGGMRAGLVGTAYAALGGALTGAVLAWLYNTVAGMGGAAGAKQGDSAAS
jgi:hypothetical protein